MAATVWKIAVVVFNSIMLAMGVIIAAVSIWVLAGDEGRVQFSKIEADGVYSENFSKVGLLEVGAVISIIVGVGMVLIAVTAFIGVIKDYKFIFGLCIGFLIFLFLLDIVVLIVTGIMKKRIDDHLEDAVMSGIRNQYQGVIASDNQFSVKLDRLMVEYECCGIDSAFDFKNYSNMWVDKTNLQVPKTCCKLKDKDAYLDEEVLYYVNIDCAVNASLKEYHEKTCGDELKDWLVEKTFVVLGIVVVIAVYKLLVLFIDWAMLRRCRDGMKRLYDKDHGRVKEDRYVRDGYARDDY